MFAIFNCLRKVALVTAGFVSIGLAAVGVILPIVPTVPFLLLAATCFSWAAT